MEPREERLQLLPRTEHGGTGEIRKSTQRRMGLLNLPAEIQLQIYGWVFPSAQNDQDGLALLCTCRQVYDLAQPIYLSNRLFVVRPLLFSDLRRYAWPGDKSRGCGYMMEENWRRGVEEVLIWFWEVVDQDVPPGRVARGGQRDPMITGEVGDEGEIAVPPNDQGQQDGEPNRSYMTSSPFDIHTAMNRFINPTSNYQGNEFYDRGSEMAQHWISTSPFAKFLRRLGREKATLIRNLKIISSDNRDLPLSGQVYDILLQSVTFMSALIRLHLAGIRMIELEKEHEWTYPGLADERCNGSCISLYEEETVLQNFLDMQVSWERWVEEERHDLFGAVTMLVLATGGLKELRLKNWHSCEGLPVPDFWWGRWGILGKKGVKTVLERRFICPGWNKVLVLEGDKEGDQLVQ